MSDLQAELLRVGLTTQDQYDRQKLQEERRTSKERRKMVAAYDPSASFPSLRSFLDYAKRELRKSPMPHTVGRMITQMHEVATSLRLKNKRRQKAHAFLAKVGEGLRSRLPEERGPFLDKVFLEAEPQLVTEE